VSLRCLSTVIASLIGGKRVNPAQIEVAAPSERLADAKKSAFGCATKLYYLKNSANQFADFTITRAVCTAIDEVERVERRE
jgi:hypothetical protein